MRVAINGRLWKKVANSNVKVVMRRKKWSCVAGWVVSGKVAFRRNGSKGAKNIIYTKNEKVC